MCAQFPNAIPSIIYADPDKTGRQNLRQASLLARPDTSLAIRVTQESRAALLPIISDILAILDVPGQTAHHFRLWSGAAAEGGAYSFRSGSAQYILSDVEIPYQPHVRIVCMSSSFPQLTHDKIKSIMNWDWTIWRGARETCPMLFGDYAANHRYTPTSTFVPAQGKPTVVFPLDEAWLAYRDPNARDPKGWIAGAQAIKNDGQYSPHVQAWGHELLKTAAAGKMAGIDAPKFWYASKINIHMHRQIHFAAANIADYGNDPDE